MDAVYLEQVQASPIHIGIFGNGYGLAGPDGGRRWNASACQAHRHNQLAMRRPFV
jgi:hypothetical protein